MSRFFSKWNHGGDQQTRSRGRNYLEFANLGVNDVLLGRGKGYYEKQGNIKFRVLMSHVVHDYDKAKKVEKTQIAQGIVDRVKSRGGKFLREQSKGSGTLVEIDDKEARTKVSQVRRIDTHEGHVHHGRKTLNFNQTLQTDRQSDCWLRP